jgi:hypothetical protein
VSRYVFRCSFNLSLSGLILAKYTANSIADIVEREMPLSLREFAVLAKRIETKIDGLLMQEEDLLMIIYRLFILPFPPLLTLGHISLCLVFRWDMSPRTALESISTRATKYK